MKSFKFVARDGSGSMTQGHCDGATSNDVLGKLREQGLTPIAVEEIEASKRAKTFKASRGRINSADLSAVFWQLATMIEGGIPITTAFATIADDTENRRLREVLLQMLARIEKGETVYSGISMFPNLFNQLVRAIILAGETSGNLGGSLRRIADYYDNKDRLIKKVKGAMVYPCFVIGFIVLIVIFIMAFIVPRFQSIFDQLGGNMPTFTKAFMGFYDFTHDNILYIIGAFVISIITLVLFGKTQNGIKLYSRIALGFPLIGKIFSQSFVTTFCTTMATLLGSGVSVLEVLTILTGMTKNDIIKNAVINTREGVIQGTNISTAMADAGFFPNLVVKMVEVGEESGSLPDVLTRTAAYYERKVETTIATMIALLEPIMIVTVGAIVCTVVLALYLPIFSMSDIK